LANLEKEKTQQETAKAKQEAQIEIEKKRIIYLEINVRKIK